MSDVKNTSQNAEKVSKNDFKALLDDKSSFDVTKSFCGFPRSNASFSHFRSGSYRGSFTDKTKYIPLYQSVQNLQQGKSVASSGSVALTTSKDFDFPNGTVPKDWKPQDGLLSMDIADISQMQRDLSERISAIEKTIKSKEDLKNIASLKEAVKNKQKISENLISSIADKALSGILQKYNSTIQ